MFLIRITRLLPGFVACLISIQISAGASASEVRPGLDDVTAPAKIRTLPDGTRADYSYWSDVSRFSGKTSVYFVGRRGRRYEFANVTTFRPSDEDRARITQLVARGHVRVLSDVNGRMTTQHSSFLDRDGRLVEVRSLGGRETYKPHDCQAVQGVCTYAFQNEFIDGTLYLRRTSSFKDGVWTSDVSLDPARDPERRDTMLERAQISYGADGLVLDSVRYRNGKLHSRLERRK